MQKNNVFVEFCKAVSKSMINHVKDKNYSSVTSFKTKALDHSLMTDGCGSVLAIFYCPIDLNLVLSLSPSQYL